MICNLLPGRRPPTRSFWSRAAGAAMASMSLAACSSSKGPTGPATGSLAVAISTPAGVSASVIVTGPGGYHQTLAHTEILAGLTPGTYAVTAAATRISHPVVATIEAPTIARTSAVVTSGDTASDSVSYAPRPGSGALWVGNAGLTVVAYTNDQLAASTNAPPHTGLGNIATSTMAFDANGNLWVVNVGSSVNEYDATDLATSGTPHPTVQINDDGHGSLNFVEGIAFDSSGDLWAVNPTNTIVEYTPDQLTASGSPTPAVTLSADSGGSLDIPTRMAFDSHGNLWVSNHENNTIVEFSTDQLKATGSPTPVDTLTAASGLDGPLGVAFDGNGTLWVTNNRDSTVLGFSATQLAAGGSPAPAVALTASGGSLNAPDGVAVDESGNLWVANPFNKTVVEFSTNQLTTSGSPTPHVVVGGSSLTQPTSLAFDPPASNLPIR